ncbi:glutaredoxin-like GlrX family protein [Nocardia brasiliensis NBRC 14402]|uniref:glutaredoxin family protein n=1 Tax=Nocardia brasiliensis TaxID=37326 RepID=UPI000317D084|nr:glutaredoxin family protein [Nocardia brasiliensis]ASF12953.1 glutaredoxin family protein [Nocardia brasiliensis]GAJ83902.1 glutaredoxin-like GlrX family protein [Nocardia brasiliensis NBRC 14402]SUB41310.1 glutaredoxin 3 [Nocardia brasiliensis]
MPNSAQPGVVVYTTAWCPYCWRLKRQLRGVGVVFTEIDVESDTAAAAYVSSVADGNRTVPTVLIGERVLVAPDFQRVLVALSAATGHAV